MDGQSDINVMVLIKGNERFIWLYPDDKAADALRSLGRFAANDELNFSWMDAAMMSQKIRQRTATE
jgi:hypothetical protein